MLLRDKILRLLWTCCLLAFYIVTPGLAVTRTVWKYSRLILITDINFALLCFSSEMPSLYFEKARRLSWEILMFFLQNAYLEKFLCFSCTVWSRLCFWSSMYLMINSLWKRGHPRVGYIWIWSMLNMKSAGCEQSLLF